jgi:predicted nucleic acid-binding Zn ribbon protein
VNYKEIKELAKELGRPIETLIALAPSNDPFYIGPPRTAAAEWFAGIWHRLGISTGYHYRRIHYLLVSQPEPIKMLGGTPYENNLECWFYLCLAARDAIALELVPQNAFVDNRNNAPIIHLIEPEDARILLAGGFPEMFGFQMPSLPRLALENPTIPQPYHLEIWAEKTTMNDILVSLAREYGMNIVTGSGELSATACRDLVNRADESDRPVRILYVSDFDPAGQSMPVAVARKIEFDIARRGADLDVEVRPVVLTHDQCVEYHLPRIPIKESERRGAAFEARYGEGATELDALEALRPGLLRRLLIKEIDRYWDHGHDDAIGATCRDIKGRLDEITADIRAEHQHQIDALEAEFQEITSAYRAWVDRARPLWQAIREKCYESAPDIDDVEWTEAFQADEDPDPLFDSTRDYVEQIDRFKRHQGKSTERSERCKIVPQRSCPICGDTFDATRSDKVVCSIVCQRKFAQQRAAAARNLTRVCPVCSSTFEAKRSDTVFCGTRCREKSSRQRAAEIRMGQQNVSDERLATDPIHTTNLSCDGLPAETGDEV